MSEKGNRNTKNHCGDGYKWLNQNTGYWHLMLWHFHWFKDLDDPCGFLPIQNIIWLCPVQKNPATSTLLVQMVMRVTTKIPWEGDKFSPNLSLWEYPPEISPATRHPHFHKAHPATSPFPAGISTWRPQHRWKKMLLFLPTGSQPWQGGRKTILPPQC